MKFVQEIMTKMAPIDVHLDTAHAWWVGNSLVLERGTGWGPRDPERSEKDFRILQSLFPQKMGWALVLGFSQGGTIL